MSDPAFIRYVGDPDFHDGSILSVEPEGDVVCVRVRGASGTVFRVDFSGVRKVRANRPEGMVLYALCELRNDPPHRRFVFANWDEESTVSLEVDAEDFTVRPE